MSASAAHGISIFAGVLLILAGVFQALEALSAIVHDQYLVVAPRYIYSFDLTAWGWIFLLLGILMIVGGFAVVKGKEWGRWFGVAVLGVAAVSNYSWIVFRPFWTLALEGIYLAGIFGLLVYGGRRDPIA